MGPTSRPRGPAAPGGRAALSGAPSGLRPVRHTFFGVPAYEAAAGTRPGLARPQGPAVGFLGAPFDLGTTLRPGARFGPDAVRAASAIGAGTTM